jgi:hypothetical protein
MGEMRKWKVEISAWDLIVVKGVEAETEEEAEDIALEWMHDDYNVDRVEAV